MTIASSQLTTYTAEAYLSLEVQSDTRSEYRNGEIAPMTGGTPEHNKIASALNALLWFGLRGKPYSVFVTDQRLWIPTVDLYTYPDVMAIADPVDLKPGRKDTVTNPLLIAEVLSDLTQSYDRGDRCIFQKHADANRKKASDCLRFALSLEALHWRVNGYSTAPFVP